ncbi:hypothetical protein AWZ03_014228 [Drosophila navojoa]|uniref:Uncharacterized protein n=1 Tax=Drosophila navojoa TaxID=7232 RepID=A0A484AUS3_DRONA|nr:hypothetical protein AWZ03_014228 [Drosophila navojoa]
MASATNGKWATGNGRRVTGNGSSALPFNQHSLLPRMLPNRGKFSAATSDNNNNNNNNNDDDDAGNGNGDGDGDGNGDDILDSRAAPAILVLLRVGAC